MFFILSKVFLMFLYPFTWFILCLAGFLFFKKEKWKKRSKIGAIVIFLVFSNTAIYLECIKRWEIHGTRIENVKNYDVHFTTILTVLVWTAIFVYSSYLLLKKRDF